jgi:catechol 2,3-dioxygenase-like lactoylglutathione lyase family enzyme
MKFNSLIPEISVSNFQKSLSFYTKIGFKLEYGRQEKNFAMLSFGNSQIMIEQYNGHWETGKLEPPFGRGINFEIECKDVDLLSNLIKDNGYKLFRNVEENWYRQKNKEVGNREFLVQDPDGYLLRFAQSLGTRNIK